MIKAHGILGFVRFLKGFYIILITARKKIAKIGLHTIYTILETKMVPLFQAVASSLDIDEKKYLQIFNQSTSTTDFYFSYTYDLTRSLQENMMRKIRNKIAKDEPILSKVSDIYAEDIYAESASNPTSRFDNT